MDHQHQLCLSWSHHQSTLAGVFENLLENESLADCTVAAEGKYHKAHKLVLSAFSPYFAALLQEQYDKHPIFMLKDIKYQELRALMIYMYRGEVHIPQSQLADLLKAAESLQIKGLQQDSNQEDNPIERTPGKRKGSFGDGERRSLRPQKVSRLSRNDGPVIENVELPSPGLQMDSKSEMGSEDFENEMPIQLNKFHDELIDQNIRPQKIPEMDPFIDLPETSKGVADEIRRLSDAIRRVEKIVKDTNPKILAGVSKLLDNNDSWPANPHLPVESFEELESLEEKVQNNLNFYIPIFKGLLVPGGVAMNLQRIIDEKILFEMNFSGKQNKKGLRKYNNLIHALYQAVKRDNYSQIEFQTDIRSSFSKIKNKIYKNKYEARNRAMKNFPLDDSEQS
ncbi:uncharacterized protein [Drosophila takahashii]|uniref:uncharacterized protein n=1 Tax=Drosophila takahashii TaxID=29030 RepID=UPI001CF8DDE8|nr:uncharacterized protein LOC108060784 [Drosophila takahashii]